MLRQARAAICLASSENAGEAAARLVLSAEHAREQAMAIGDLKTALLAVKIQSDILLAKQVKVLLGNDEDEDDAGLPTLPHLRTLGAEILRERVRVLARADRMRHAADRAGAVEVEATAGADWFDA